MAILLFFILNRFENILEALFTIKYSPNWNCNSYTNMPSDGRAKRMSSNLESYFELWFIWHPQRIIVISFTRKFRLEKYFFCLFFLFRPELDPLKRALFQYITFWFDLSNSMLAFTLAFDINFDFHCSITWTESWK